MHYFQGSTEHRPPWGLCVVAVIVLWLLLIVPRVSLQSVIVVFLGHTQLRFVCFECNVCN